MALVSALLEVNIYELGSMILAVCGFGAVEGFQHFSWWCCWWLSPSGWLAFAVYTASLGDKGGFDGFKRVFAVDAPGEAWEERRRQTSLFRLQLGAVASWSTACCTRVSGDSLKFIRNNGRSRGAMPGCLPASRRGTGAVAARSEAQASRSARLKPPSH